MWKRLSVVAVALVVALGLFTGVIPRAMDAVGATLTAGRLPVLQDWRPSRDVAFKVNDITLVNRNHPVSAAYRPRVVGKFQMSPQAEQAFRRLQAAARAEGLTIVWRYGYRSYETQAQLRVGAAERYGSQAEADRYVAPEGMSEHQTGMAVDVAAPQARGAAFEGTPEYRWLRQHAHEYGFILRYPPGKEHITGYAFEPWHYRYVPRAVAAEFGANSTLTLEEYLGGR